MSLFVSLLSPAKSPHRGTPGYAKLIASLDHLAGTDRLVVEDKNLISVSDIPWVHVLQRPVRIAAAFIRTRRYRKTPAFALVLGALREFFSSLRASLQPGAVHYLVRNRNITEAHVSLWQRGLDSGKDYISVFEDDLVSIDDEFSDRIDAFCDYLTKKESSETAWALLLSQSFSESVQGLPPKRLARVDLGNHQLIFGRDFGWADSTAATVFNRGFLRVVTDFVLQQPPSVKNTVPIDWLVDLALVQNTRLLPMRTFHVIPGLCRQSSLKN